MTATTIAIQDPLLTSREVRMKIATCIGGTGIYVFRKWTRCEPPVLPRHVLPQTKLPRYRLSDVLKACADLQSSPTPPQS